MTPEPDPHIAVIGPLALACLRGECPPEILEDKVEETGWSPPQEVRADRIRRLWARWPWKIADETECSLLAIVAYWRECQAAAALRDAPPGGAGTCYHETPRKCAPRAHLRPHAAGRAGTEGG
jgi:hypothetical protein